MDVLDLPLGQIIPYARNPRNNAQAIATVAASIREFGWRQPIVVDEALVVLAGHTRLEAARKLGLKTAPVHVAKGLSEAQARAFRIMDNRSSENAEWDNDLLNLELADLLEAEFDLGLTGFTEDELNALMNSLEDGTGPQEGEDDIPDTPEDPASRLSYGFRRLPRYWKPLHATPFMACSGGGWIVRRLVFSRTVSEFDRPPSSPWA